MKRRKFMRHAIDTALAICLGIFGSTIAYGALFDCVEARVDARQEIRRERRDQRQLRRKQRQEKRGCGSHAEVAEE